jgi:hypothetical protein
VKILAHLLFAAATWPMAAIAQSGPASGEPAEQRSPRQPRPEQQPAAQAPIDSDGERRVPDYDGRGEAPASAGEIALWVPRVILFPLYVVTEFVIRRPLGALATATEKSGVLGGTLGGGPRTGHGVVPTGLIDYGFRSSVGLYFWADDPRFAGHQFRLRATTGGPGYVNLTLRERIPLAQRDQLSLRGEYDLRSDWVFHGLGPRSPSDPLRYGAQRFDGKLGYQRRLWRTSGVAAWLGVRELAFEGGVDGDGDPNLEQAVASGRLQALPPGLRGGYTVGVAGARAALDTRRRRYADPLVPASDFVTPPLTGARIAARAEYATGFREPEPSGRYEWIAWGGTLAAFADLDQRQRVLGLTLDADFVAPFGDRAEPPFTELASLGGDRMLRGFVPGRLIDRSAISLQTDYQFPIWVWLDGAAHYAVGNVFGAELEGFDPALLRSSFGVGLRSSASRDHVFELLVALGTETFTDGGEIESFRLVVGASSGF